MVRPMTAHESVRENLRDAIRSGHIAPGSRLVQSEVAEEFGVSTTPVREALRDLAAEGLIRFDSFRGAVVHIPTAEEVEEVYELRILLEALAVRRSVGRITTDELAVAAELMDRMNDCGDPVQWSELNRDFHSTLMESGMTPRLKGLLRGLRDAAGSHVAFSLAGEPERMVDGNRAHRELLDAYRKGDVERAVRTSTAHLEDTVAVIRRILERQSEPG